MCTLLQCHDISYPGLLFSSPQGMIDNALSEGQTDTQVSVWRNLRIHLKVNNNSSWLKSIQSTCNSWTWPLCFDKNIMLFHFFRSHFPNSLFMLELSTSSLCEISDNANSIMTCFQTCPSLQRHDLLFWYSRRLRSVQYFTDLKQTPTELIFSVSIPVGNYLTIIHRPVRLLRR